MFFLCHYVIEADYAHADRSNSVDQRLSNKHTYKLYPLHYPPYSSPLSPPPLSPPFQQGNSVLSNIFQMSNTSLPSFPVLVPSFLTLTGSTETPKPPTPTTVLDTLLSATKHEPMRSGRTSWSSPKAERNA